MQYRLKNSSRFFYRYDILSKCSIKYLITYFINIKYFIFKYFTNIKYYSSKFHNSVQRVFSIILFIRLFLIFHGITVFNESVKLKKLIEWKNWKENDELN